MGKEKKKKKAARRKLMNWIFFVVLVALVGGIAYTSYSKTKKETRRTIQDYQSTESVYTGDLRLTILASSTLHPYEIVQVRPEASGKVEELFADVGDWVNVGDPLATLDQENLLTQLDSARASLTQARARLSEVERGWQPSQKQSLESNVESAELALREAQEDLDYTADLHASGFASDEELDSAQAAVEQAQQNLDHARDALRVLLDGSTEGQLLEARASVQLAQVRVTEAENALGDATVYSPMSGVILSRDVTVGSVVVSTLASFSVGDSLFTIGDLTTMKSIASVNESDIGFVEQGQEVILEVDSYPDEEFHGTVTKIHPQASQASGVTSFTVEIDVPNDDGRLMAGMSAEVQIVTDSFDSLLLIPDVALAEKDDKYYVFVVDDNQKIEIREVETGETNYEETEILSGLEVGEQVIVKGVPRDLLEEMDKGSNSGISVRFD